MKDLLWTPRNYKSKLTLRKIYNTMPGDSQGEIPKIVWLLENPKSSISLPGSVDLYGHDCLHIILNMGVTNIEEAFVVGFTMGNCSDTNRFHTIILKLIGRVFYPGLFRFSKKDLKAFNLGYKYGQNLQSVISNIHTLNFKKIEDWEIRRIRGHLGISSNILKSYEKKINKIIETGEKN